MKTREMLLMVFGLLAGSVLTSAYNSYQGRGSYDGGVMPMMGWGRQSSGAMMGVGIDRHFIEQMIPHHNGAIDMALLAKERSQRPELLNLADAIIESQTAENEQMRNWHKEWYGIEVVVDDDIGVGMGRGMMHGGMMGGTSDIEDLEQAEDFDTAFLREMIPHHQMAVMMAQMLLASTEKPEMRQLAENIIKAQEAEIEQMRVWLVDRQ